MMTMNALIISRGILILLAAVMTLLLSACDGTFPIPILNHAPVANNQTIATNEDTEKAITLSAQDAEGDILTFILTQNPQHGTLSGTAPNLTYTPYADFNGSDSFTFKANDGTVDSNEATVAITVVSVNDAPTVDAGTDQVISGNFPTTLECTGSDVDGTIIYKWLQGSIEVASSQSYTTPALSAGTYTYTCIVTDNNGSTASDSVAIVVAVPTPDTNTTTLYVTAEDGSGDYICDGMQDEEEINAALDRVASDSNLTTVYLKGPMTCVIEEPIIISSHTKLMGDATVKVQLKDHTEWPDNKPLIAQKGGEYWDGDSLTDKIYGRADDVLLDVEIGGFELTAGTQDASYGSWDYILMIFYGASDLRVHDMYLHHSYGDFIRIMSAVTGMNKRVNFYNNKMEYSGHDGLYLGYISDLEIFDNKIYSTRTNDGIRVEECDTVSIHGNTVGNSLANVPSGYAGILLGNSEMPAGSAAIYNNYIYGKAGGIVLEGGSTKNFLEGVHVHHNRIFKAFDNTAGGDHFLNGGIHIHGAHNTLIEYNTIEGSYKDGIVFEIGAGTETGYRTIVRNNIISNSTSYGLNNIDSDKHTFVSEYNNIYNSSAGDYNNTSSDMDIHTDPLYATSTDTNDSDAVDLHLRSEYGRWNGTVWVTDAETSPAIDRAKPSSDYSNEPNPNGGRGNLGAYGNTHEASKSP